MRLFDYYSNLYYSLTPDNKTVLIKNIMQKVGIRQSIKDASEAYMDYKLVEGDRPEIIAHKVYGSVNYHWVVLLMNDVCNPYYDWILSESEVEKLTDKRYGFANRNATHHYIDADGNVVTDEGNIEQLAGILKYEITNLEHELKENENRRNIKILDPVYLTIAVNEIKALLE